MIYDVLIVGAGPCGLAVAARLREQTPSALFTEDEHNRFWRKSRKAPVTGKTKIKNSSAAPKCSMLVLDAHSSKWMSSWEDKFEALQISHLRSPLFFHPDPQDRDGLLAYAHQHDRCSELCRIDGVVGKELSKHQKKNKNKRRSAVVVPSHLSTDQRDQNDYFRPSRDLFSSYCSQVVKRYNLHHCVEKQTVKNILFGYFGPKTEALLFQVEGVDATYLARSVVLAVGAGSKAQVPTTSTSRPFPASGRPCHCLEDSTTCELPPHVLKKLENRQPTQVVVVGGGLTGAQLSDLFIRQGVSKVWLLQRGRYKVKHFDLGLEWVTKIRNHNLAKLWSAESDNERLEMLKDARNGGSFTPEYDKILQKHVSNGLLCIRSNTQVMDINWNPEHCKWEISTQPVIEDQLLVDHVVYATENKACLEKVSCIQTLREDFSISSLAGLPLLTDDLMWRHDVPLFVTGQLAGLRLGPGAGNLSGARLGAERIAWKIEKLMSAWHEQENDAQDQQEAAISTLQASYLLENRYEILASA